MNATACSARFVCFTAPSLRCFFSFRCDSPRDRLPIRPLSFIPHPLLAHQERRSWTGFAVPCAILRDSPVRSRNEAPVLHAAVGSAEVLLCRVSNSRARAGGASPWLWRSKSGPLFTVPFVAETLMAIQCSKECHTESAHFTTLCVLHQTWRARMHDRIRAGFSPGPPGLLTLRGIQCTNMLKS